MDVIRKSVTRPIQTQGRFATNVRYVIRKSVTRPIQ